MLYPLLRLMLLLVSAFGATLSRDSPPPALLAPHTITVPVVMAALAWVDLHRRDEVLFFGNLGIGLGTLVAMYVAPALVFELVLLLL